MPGSFIRNKCLRAEIVSPHTYHNGAPKSNNSQTEAMRVNDTQHEAHARTLVHHMLFVLGQNSIVLLRSHRCCRHRHESQMHDA